jgi:hypothetical protein
LIVCALAIIVATQALSAAASKSALEVAVIHHNTVPAEVIGKFKLAVNLLVVFAGIVSLVVKSVTY